MAYKLCPFSCITKNKNKENYKLPTDGDLASVMWDTFCPMVFCSDVFPPTSTPKKEPTEMSNTCWYCHIENSASGKFVTKKSSDPVPDEVRRIQEALGFNPGEPLTTYNFHKIIPSWKTRRFKSNHSAESMRQARPSSTPLQVSSLNVLPSFKRKWEQSGHPPLKKYAYDRYGKVVPINVTQRSTSEHQKMKPILNSSSLASV